MKPEITENTIVDRPRLDVILKLLQERENSLGDIAEVGVYKGGTAYLLCDNAKDKHVYLFDTFEGMPEAKEGIDNHVKGDFNDTSLETVSALLSPFTNKTIVKGVFPRANTDVVKDKYFSVVHLDCDIYDSVKECLEFFWPRLYMHGVIILDDYLEPNCPGAYKAVTEFMSGKWCALEHTVQSQAILYKIG